MYEQEEQVKEKKSFFSYLGIILGSVATFLFGSIEAVVTALAFCVILYLFILTPHQVIGQSMHPTYKNKEYLLANKLVYNIKEPQRGDVIIFKYSATRDYIKRIIGLPGDTVSLRDGYLYVNGEKLNENTYLSSTVVTNKGSYLDEGETITVPENMYFVCGDNRPHSSDSREFGPISRSDIKAKVWIVYFPFSNFRVVQHVKYDL